MLATKLAWPALLLVTTYVWPKKALSILQGGLIAWCFLAVLDMVMAAAQARANHSAIMAKKTIRRLALVTGASAGLGKEIATQLAQQGYSLLLVARREPLLQQLRKELLPHTENVAYCTADLATQDGIDRVINFVREQKLEVDVLVNNAGASVRRAVTELSCSQVDQIVQLNVAAATKLTHALVPDMVARHQGGHVLVISSMAGEMPNPYAAIYAAGKAYLTSFSTSLNYELQGTGVQVTTFLPGPLRTEFGIKSQTENAIYMNGPGNMTVHGCALAAIKAMDDAMTTVAYDKWTTQVATFVVSRLLPLRIRTFLTALAMQDPEHLWRTLRGSETTKVD